jgi:hypothetical protein
LAKDRLAVGDSTQLEIIFSTKRYRNRVTKQPRIQTNEGPPDKTVQIMATVVARPDSTYPVIIKPYKLDLTQIGDKVRDEIRFTIDNVSEQPLSANLVSSHKDLFNVTLPDQIGPGQTGEGILKLTQEGVDGEFEKSFTIQLSDETGSRFTVPVKRSIRQTAQDAKAAEGYGGK